MKKTKFTKVAAVILCVVMVISMIPVTTFAAGSESEQIMTYQSFESTLAPGITQTINSGIAADGKLINYYIAIADIGRDDVGVQATYKDAQCETLGMSKMTEQAAAMNKKHSNPEDAENYIQHYAVVAGVNGLVEENGNYYFITKSGLVAKNQKRTITEETANGLVEPGRYTFDEDGKMVI